MSREKLGFTFVLLLVALVGGWFFSNYLVLLLLGMRDTPQAWNTWWQYVQAMALPSFAPYSSRIQLSGAVGFGIPVLLWALLLIPLLKAKAESLHGDASFATLHDLKKAGLLRQTTQSILLGKFKAAISPHRRLGGWVNQVRRVDAAANVEVQESRATASHHFIRNVSLLRS
jgi:type IV secretion system protein VirD4